MEPPDGDPCAAVTSAFVDPTVNTVPGVDVAIGVGAGVTLGPTVAVGVDVGNGVGTDVAIGEAVGAGGPSPSMMTGHVTLVSAPLAARTAIRMLMAPVTE
jgi:hypothetical protein